MVTKTWIREAKDVTNIQLDRKPIRMDLYSITSKGEKLKVFI
jgi:hypothetical protein